MPDDQRTRAREGDPHGVKRSGSRGATLRRTITEFRDDGLTDWAAALTYYGLLSLFPALVAVTALVGLVTRPDELVDALLRVAPASAAQTLEDPIRAITSDGQAAGIALAIGLAGALWGASGYVGAFGRAQNVILEVREGRPFWKLRPLQMLLTLVAVLLLAVVTAGLVLTGPVVEAFAEPLGLGGTAVTAWGFAKWPVLLAIVVVIFCVLYYVTPNVAQRRFRAVLPGVLLAIVVWALATAGFAIYAASFGTYDRTYGTLGGVVVLLVWLWLTNVALLLGAELNAERERSAEFREGVRDAERRIQLPRRDPAGPPATE